MSRLIVMPDADPSTVLVDTSEVTSIAASLDSIGVVFERWVADGEIGADADQNAVISAYAESVDRIKAQGFTTVDVVRMAGDASDEAFVARAAEARAKFLAEHTHDDDEVRFFVEGSGAFYLRADGKVHVVVCTAGDYIFVPKDTRHWFDMGTSPCFTAIRFFAIPEGWVGRFTGDDIASGFATYDELVGAGS